MVKFGAMENSCEQCNAILRECRIAYLDFWERASKETRDSCKALGKLIGGSEADMRVVEARLPRFRPMSAEKFNSATFSYFPGEDRLRDAMLNKWRHQHATGHIVNIPFGKF